MREYIERETAKSVICNAEGDFANKVSNNWLRPKFAEAIAKTLDKIPAADVVEVVRCGECERRNKSADLTDTVYCPWLKLQMRKNDFCSYGERRNDG